MGKSYIRIRCAGDDAIGADRSVSRMTAKIPKISMHGRHQSLKNCRVCQTWQWGNRNPFNRPKKYYKSKKHLADGGDFNLSAHKKRCKQPVKLKECCICYKEVENYGFNQVQCGPRMLVKTVCCVCKAGQRAVGSNECPLCRSHKI